MIQYQCSVRLGGSMNQVIAGKVVTIPEMAILKVIHGGDAVVDLRPYEAVPRSDEDERERLKKLYDNATPDSDGSLVDKMFHPYQPLPRRLSAVGIDPAAEAARLRAEAEQRLNAANELAGAIEEHEEENVDELFGGPAAPAPARKAKAGHPQDVVNA